MNKAIDLFQNSETANLNELETPDQFDYLKQTTDSSSRILFDYDDTEGQEIFSDDLDLDDDYHHQEL